MENGLELCVVPAFAVLQARREALDACGDDAQALGIWMNVCLLARAIYRDGARAFSGGEALMRTEDYAALCREEYPACSEENAQKAMQALEQEDYERLKWRVLRAFGVLPGEARARRMTDRAYLYCAAQMMLDEQEKLDAMCPSCREENAGFDERRFEELRDAGVCETASSGADETCGAV